MNIIFQNQKTEKCFSDYNKLKKLIPFEWVKTIKKIINQLEAANCFGDYLTLGLNHPEQINQNGGTFYSLRITANVRLIIKLNSSINEINECTEIEIQGVCDYHGDKSNWFIP